jgi:hypothetical protein
MLTQTSAAQRDHMRTHKDTCTAVLCLSWADSTCFYLKNRHQIDGRSCSRARTIPMRDWLAVSGRRKPGSASMKPGFESSFAISRRTYSVSSAPAARTSALRVSRPSTTETTSSRS